MTDKSVKTVNGPYIHTTGRLEGRSYVDIYFDDGTKTTKLYSRFLMEKHLGRKLKYDETVDHINEDPTDDRLENLQVLSRSENARKSASKRSIEMITFRCPECGEWVEKKARNVRSNRKKGRDGPFCGKSCAGKHSARKQYSKPG